MHSRILISLFFNGLCFSLLIESSNFVYSLDFDNLTDTHLFYQKQLDHAKDQMNKVKIESITLEVKKDETSDQTITRPGFIAIRPDALGTIVFCHGYTSSKHEAFFFKTFFPQFNAIAFDFRGHGDCVDGQFSTIGHFEIYDVFSAVDYIKNHPDMKHKPIIGFGFSMGAVSLMRAQEKWENLFDMLILDSPFDSSDDCMSRGLDKLFEYKLFGRTYHLPGKSLIMKSLYSERFSPVIKTFFKWTSGLNPYAVPTKFVPVDPLKDAGKIKVPCLFIYCEKDNKVSVEAIKRLYDAVNSPFKRMWITKGIKHCGSYLSHPELYWYKLNRFVEKVLSGKFQVRGKIRDDRVTIEAG